MRRAPRSARRGLKQISAPEDPFEAQANRDALVELSGALKVVAVSLTKIAQDLALMGSGPRAGIGELFLPELQKGSSIMPGKVNPVIPEVVLQVAAQVIGNDTAITIGGMQGNFELNVRVPLIARNLLESLELLASAATRARREVRRRASRPTAPAPTPPRRAHARRGDGAEPLHRLRPGDRDRPGGDRSGRPLREVAREAGRQREALDAAHRPAQDGARQRAEAAHEPVASRARGGRALASRPLAACSVRAALRERLVEVAALRRLHARGAAVAAAALAIRRCASATELLEAAKAMRVMPTPPGWPSWMKIVGPPVCGWALVERPADVPAVAHREQRQHRDLRVLGGVQRAEQQPRREGLGERLGVELEPDRLRREARRRQLERDDVDLAVVDERRRW